MESSRQKMGCIHKPIKCIVISGIDGSGKSTIIKSLKKSLEENGLRVSCIWLRFNHYITKAMHTFARITGLSCKVKNEMGYVWQHCFYKSKPFCQAYIVATYFDSWLSRLKYNRVAVKSDVVICDRWITDVLVDLATKTHNVSLIKEKWAERFIKIMPKQHRLFLIFRNTQSLLECRLENRIDPDFCFRLKVYDILLSRPYIVPIDNNGTIEDSVIQIKRNINE